MLIIKTDNVAKNTENSAGKPAEEALRRTGRTGNWSLSVLSAKIAFFSFSGFLLRRVHDLLLLSILLAIAAAGISRFINIDSHQGIKRLIRYEQRVEKPMLAAVRRAAPTRFMGYDFSFWMLLGSVYFLSVGFGVGGTRLFGHAERLRLVRSDRNAPDYLLRKASAGGKLERNELLEVYVEAKRSLDAQKRNLAFLSIDVVDSTGMKAGEEPGMAERDFIRYKKIVEEILKKNHSLKSTWTPDGVMICFDSVADAVLSAQEIIIALDKFNREVKVIKRDFAIRAGINSGDVFYDRATPMEEMTDRVIDIAGHMQKHGCVNGVTISRHSIEPLLGEFNFRDAGRVVDAFDVYEWKWQTAAF